MKTTNKDFPDEFYGDNGVYIPRLHGKTIYEWTELGLRTMKEIKQYAQEEEEKRMDIIGSNGNEGLHYCPDQKKGEE